MKAGLLRAVPPLAWSAFLAWLWLSGGVARYVGARTSWVVVFGAVALGLVGLSQLLGAFRSRTGRRLRPGEALGALVLLLPVLVVLAAPHAELGAYAASKRTASAPAPSKKVFPPPKSKLTFSDLHYASQFVDQSRSFGAVPGTHVDISGFVTHPSTGARGTFAVTRFYIFCCIADAEAFSAQIDATKLAPSDYPNDQWLHIVGVTALHGRKLIVVASRIGRVPKPSKPYLTP